MGMISKAKVFPAEYNQEPGMNDELRKKDSVTWEVDPEMMFKGKMMNLDDMSGPQVGPPYDADAMGESRERITYPSGSGSSGKKVKSRES